MRRSAFFVVVMAAALALAAAPASAGHGGGGGHGRGQGSHGHEGHGFHDGFHHRHFFGGPVFVGPGLWWDPLWYPYAAYPEYPWYPYSPVVTQPEPQPEASAYWYYCSDAKAYYPYVQECPGGWVTVAPTPAAPTPAP